VVGPRWLPLPLYFALFAAESGICCGVGYLWHASQRCVAADFSTFHDTGLLLPLCDALDLVLAANLLAMVAVSSYESYLSRIITSVTGSPEKLGMLDAGNVQVNLAVVTISMLHPLRACMHVQGYWN